MIRFIISWAMPWHLYAGKVYIFISFAALGQGSLLVGGISKSESPAVAAAVSWSSQRNATWCPEAMFLQKNESVLITNWQALAWDSEEAIKKRRSVDKRGAKSDEAYTREVLGEMANAQNILVINDEAHHAWRKNPENKGKLTKEQKEAEQQATIWIASTRPGIF